VALTTTCRSIHIFITGIATIDYRWVVDPRGTEIKFFFTKYNNFYNPKMKNSNILRINRRLTIPAVDITA
jgi:hypothetical protein